MGVKGLWSLLNPVARPVQIESMEGKRLAIDSSIWLYQFQATMRDKDGRVLVNAHVLGFLRRINKLLFHGIKPVFVFDGGAPVLKRATIAERKKRKAGAAANHAKTAEKLFAAQMRREAVKVAQAQRDQQAERTAASAVAATSYDEDAGDQIADDAIYLEDLEGRPGPSRPPLQPVPSASSSKQSVAAAPAAPLDPAEERRKKFRKHDPYKLPEASVPTVSTDQRPDARLATEEELKQFIDEVHPEDIDVESAEFRALPTEVQYEIIGDLRIRSRQQSHRRLADMLRAAPSALDFSMAQIKHLSQRNALTQQLLTVTDMVGKAHLTIPVRIAAERNREYVLVKRGEDDGGGWALGIREGTKAKPIEIDPDERSPSLDSDENSDDSDVEEVPAPAPPAVDPDLREHRRREILEAIAARYVPKKPARASLDLPVQPFGKPRAPGAQPLFVPEEEEDVIPTANDEALALALQQEELGSDEEMADDDLARALAQSRRDAENRQRKQSTPPQALSADESDDMEEVSLVPSERTTPQNLSEAPTPIVDEEEDDLDVVHIPSRNVPARLKSSAQVTANGGLAKLDKSLKKEVDPDQEVRPTVSSKTSQTLPREAGSDRRATVPTSSVDVQRSSSRALLANGQKAVAKSTLASGDSARSSEAVFDNKPSKGATKEPARRAVDTAPVQTPVFAMENTPNGLHGASEPLVTSPIEAVTPLAKPSEDRFTPQISAQAIQKSSVNQLSTLTSASRGTIQPPSMPAVVPQKRKISMPVASATKDTSLNHAADLGVSALGTIEMPDLIARPSSSRERSASNYSEQEQQESTDDEDEDLDDSRSIEWSKSPSPRKNRRPALQTEDSAATIPSEPEDEDIEMTPKDMVAEEDDYARFIASIKNRDLNDVRTEIDDEIRVLHSQAKVALRDSDEITTAMVAQIQTLLRHFGIPYITAPMEAEAQCAKLAELNLVDGIITDDSDVFLFGGTQCFKNIFNDAKYAECFLAADIERELSLSRERLITLAYFLGSDYTIGLPGVGPVVALELMANFPGAKSIEDFKLWWMKVQRGQDSTMDSDTKWKKSFKKRYSSSIYLTADWPNHLVREAYKYPTTDESEEPFHWGFPKLSALRSFLHEELSWSISKVDDELTPIVQRIARRGKMGALNKQGTLDPFFDLSIGQGNYAPRRRTTANVSKRLMAVIKQYREAEARVNGQPMTDWDIMMADLDEEDPKGRGTGKRRKSQQPLDEIDKEEDLVKVAADEEEIKSAKRKRPPTRGRSRKGTASSISRSEIGTESLASSSDLPPAEEGERGRGRGRGKVGRGVKASSAVSESV